MQIKNKKIVSALLVLTMVFAMFAFWPMAAYAATTATPTAQTVLVNGENVDFDAYNIEGSNYFKLRDLAYALKDTQKCFEVEWDSAAGAILLTSGRPYTPVGGEMASKGSGDKTPVPTDSKVFLDGKEVSFSAYNIEDNNYFKLRDIGQALDFGVDWIESKFTISIETGKPYAQENWSVPDGNLVDERFELIALIFRLAGREEYAVSESNYMGRGADYENYHISLKEFEKFKDHPAVEYASGLDIDILKYVVHIKEDLSGLVDDIEHLLSLNPFAAFNWTRATATKFCSLVLEFRDDTGFAEFFSENIPFYKTLSEPFLKDEIISSLDMAWWMTIAERFDKYTAKLHDYRFIVSPSLHMASQSAWNSDTVYGVLISLFGRIQDSQYMSAHLVHEYNHSFGTAAGVDAFMTIEKFAEWVDATNPAYGGYDDWMIIAEEYMVRAYTILYFADHGYTDMVAFNIDESKDLGFDYIEEVYELVRELEGRD